MAWVRPDDEYWRKKIIAYFHDPIDKAFGIKGHENRANEIIKILTGDDKPSDEFWKIADAMAASFERGILPTYSQDENKSGAVDFIKNSIITHPTSEKDYILNIEIPDNVINKHESIYEDFKKFLEEERDYLENIKKDSPFFYKFTYSHLLFRFKLAYKNIGKLGGFWHRIPADTRFPDHSIWQHNATTSAISSCIYFEDKIIDNAGLMVFSITPVQSFISKARKLRDFWIGSIILSWLAFEGIIWIIENLGCDHIIYPSLIDQNLVYQYLTLKNLIKKDEEFLLNKESSIASFPNKFLFFIPFDKADDIANEIQKAIESKWYDIKEKLINLLNKDLGINKDDLNEIVDRQFTSYWDFNWSATKLLNDSIVKFEGKADKNNEDLSDILFNKNQLKEQIALYYDFKKINELINPKKTVKAKDKNNEFDDYDLSFDLNSIGVFYSSTHSLVQGLLASNKQKKVVRRKPENGEKCSICGEYEVLNTFNTSTKKEFGAKEYKENISSLWNKIVTYYNKSNNESEIKENERLCSICLSKRLFNRIIANQKDHILKNSVENAESFPQTSEISFYNYFERKGIKNKSERRRIAQEFYENKRENNDDKEDIDCYYAILKMDGDRMGDLINGKTIGSKWNTIMHPDIINRLKGESYFKDVPVLKQKWNDILDKKRFITPSIHMSISESLGDFSAYFVPGIIEKYGGRLIYAGGDDVCAVLPLSNVLKAAKEIKESYNRTFNSISYDKNKNEINITNLKEIEYEPSEKEKLSINLGYSNEISISAGILICHFKDNLSHMIEKADRVLKMAKKEGGRNAMALCLKKRSGQERYFITKWHDDKDSNLDIFLNIIDEIEKNISHSLIYRLDNFKEGIEAIIKYGEDIEENITKFIAIQLEKSDTKSSLVKNLPNKEDKKNKYKEISSNILKLILRKKGDNYIFNIEPMIIASFLSKINEENKTGKNN